ncbi:membrane protein [Ligilactobacillus salitolerans]|uniref:Membrane protein n=1 Tax=Ligilactobacillus salitolerans TaxID=1808352 RepID=A0A401IV15_9LACO|nr:MupG family TIM beta-alpha barrel fold protein [Ligilactobacillus salitolerans]GBG95345.1 membrane protein [Ligilactobacillus salitolerans]
MRQLGISIYPEQSDFKRDQQYLQLAKKYGYRRIFTSLLQLKGEGGDDILAKFKKTVAYANDLGFKTVVDVNPALFSELGLEYTDLHVLHDLGVWGMRLDEGFTGMEEAQMTHNPYGLKIELNMSRGTNYLDSILPYAPELSNLIGCHNFYPQEYTALSDEIFMDYSQKYRQYSLHTAAFVSSHTATFGPWPVNEGLPTMESDRARSIYSQVTHLRLTGMIDDVIIGNAYASEEELAAAAQAFNADYPTLHVEFAAEVSDLEKEIVLTPNHLYRGDASAFLLRDTLPRVVHQKEGIAARPSDPTLNRGDVVVVNDQYARYKGELQIVLTTMPNDGRRNYVGHLTQDDLALLDLIKPWNTFNLSK